MNVHMTNATTAELPLRPFVAQAHVNDQLLITERGNTILSALALAQYIVDALAERPIAPTHRIEILIERQP